MVEYREPGSKHLFEEYAYVLDFMQFGKPGARVRFRPEATAQLVGESYFTLLEANVKAGITLKPYDIVYVGKENRKEIAYILGRISYDELSANAKIELENAVEKIIFSKEGLFVKFFNTCQPITPRMHTLELIPGIGKKYMWDILNERDKNPFESFEDIKARTSISNPARMFAKRVIEELMGDNKHRIFTRPY